MRPPVSGTRSCSCSGFGRLLSPAAGRICVLIPPPAELASPLFFSADFCLPHCPGQPSPPPQPLVFGIQLLIDAAPPGPSTEQTPNRLTCAYRLRPVLSVWGLAYASSFTQQVFVEDVQA